MQQVSDTTKTVYDGEELTFKIDDVNVQLSVAQMILIDKCFNMIEEKRGQSSTELYIIQNAERSS